MNERTNNETLAFEYVLGTLEGNEREAFIAKIRSDEALLNEVRYWESALMPSLDNLPQLDPNPATFSKIKASIDSRIMRPNENKPLSFWEKLLPWKMATASTMVLLLLLSTLLLNNSMQLNESVSSPNADYVAVLVDGDNNPVVTALAVSNGGPLWLKWENWSARPGYRLQLWSQSREDGEIHPILVFDGEQPQEMPLDKASWRLIKGSSHLLITQEAIDSPPVDKPSELIVAKGICIRLTGTNPHT